MLTHWISATEECSAWTRLFSAMETIVVSSTAATPPMISAVSARRASPAAGVGGASGPDAWPAWTAPERPSVTLIALSSPLLRNYLVSY